MVLSTNEASGQRHLRKKSYPHTLFTPSRRAYGVILTCAVSLAVSCEMARVYSSSAASFAAAPSALRSVVNCPSAKSSTFDATPLDETPYIRDNKITIYLLLSQPGLKNRSETVARYDLTRTRGAHGPPVGLPINEKKRKW